MRDHRWWLEAAVPPGSIPDDADWHVWVWEAPGMSESDERAARERLIAVMESDIDELRARIAEQQRWLDAHAGEGAAEC